MSAPVPIHEHAIDHLRYIRKTMERAGSFTAVPGKGGVVMGCVAIAAGLAAARLSPLGPSEPAWLVIWLTAAIAGVLAGLVTMSRKARANGTPLLGASGRKFWLSFAPAIVASCLLTVSLTAQRNYQPLPGVWLLSYGTAIISGGTYSIRLIPLMGACFLALGGVTLFLPAAWATPMLVLGFGGLHILFGAIIARRHGG